MAGGRRVVTFAGRSVILEWRGPGAEAAASLIEGSSSDLDAAPPAAVFTLEASEDPPLVTLRRGQDRLYRGRSLGSAAHVLLQEALFSLIEGSDGGLVLHAAFLARGSSGVLLPGPTGSGKSMLAAWLALHGLAPLSDEAAYLPAGDEFARPFARPFCFKRSWAEVLGIEPPAGAQILRDGRVHLVPPALFNPAPRPTRVAPRLIVFPQFAAGADFSLTSLTSARAAVRLMESLANARNLDGHGVGQVADLARSVEAWALTYGRFEQLGPLLERIEAAVGEASSQLRPAGGSAPYTNP